MMKATGCTVYEAGEILLGMLDVPRRCEMSGSAANRLTEPWIERRDYSRYDRSLGRWDRNSGDGCWSKSGDGVRSRTGALDSTEI